jgi:glyoxylase-like metal-dependent hydrolase (beta-lactamase superfamily II)
VIIERILAPNPGLYTGPGTNTYLVGDGKGMVLIDPGPLDASHEEAILRAVGSREVTAVVVTHAHVDHAPLANPVSRALGVRAIGHSRGPGFEPDELIGDGSTIEAGGVRLTAIHTPGHSDDHMCFLAEKTLFTGDHIMGGSSVLVADVGPYMASLERLKELDLERLLPGHGLEMDQPTEVISWYIAHRRQREVQILDAVLSGANTIGSVVEAVYVDVDPQMHPLAVFSVGAHLRKLAAEGAVVVGGDDWSSPVEPVSALE